MTTALQLDSLNEAYQILKTASGKCAGHVAFQPWRTLDHAKDYITEQADALLAPIFTEEL